MTSANILLQMLNVVLNLITLQWTSIPSRAKQRSSRIGSGKVGQVSATYNFPYLYNGAHVIVDFSTYLFVLQGMEELHKTSIGCHGNLKSTNVLVDSYWICKVADYGLQTFRESNLHRKETLHTLSGYWLASFASLSISSFICLLSQLNLFSCFSAG